jgi:hypothetical protein
MPTSRKPLEVDAGRVFRWSFLVIFLALEWIVWDRLCHRPMRRPDLRPLVFLLAPWATRRAALLAVIGAGAATVAGMVLVRLIVAPLSSRWLRPDSDPSSWMFHLSAAEAPEASVPARSREEGEWRPGSLVLTGRRVWFLPSGWGPQPWSMARGEIARVEPVPPAFARYLPVRHWPDEVRFTGRSGEVAAFAVEDPDAVLAWFAATVRGTVAPPPPRGRAAHEGVSDA